MTFPRSRVAAFVLAVCGLAGAADGASTSGNLLGSIAGFVKDPAGVPQMGATIFLYNRYERLIGQCLTNDQGEFELASLSPDTYAIRVQLASFLPAIRRNIAVQPGMRSLLSVNLATVFSSIELVYNAPAPRASMTEDWKMVLRSSNASRPVLRLLPSGDWEQVAPGSQAATAVPIFSETQGIVRFAGSERAGSSLYTNGPDLGTAFALATSVYGKNQVQFSGNFGYAPQSGAPTSGFRTSFSREMAGGMTPEVALTMRQLAVPLRAGMSFLNGQPGAPALRTLSLTFSDTSDVSDFLHVQYGFMLESVSFIDRVNYVSPFARLFYETPEGGQMQFAYFSGMPSAEMFAGPNGDHAALQEDVMALSMFPRVSLRNGNAQVQRIKSYELGYSKDFGSHTVTVSAYRDDISNVALTMVGAAGMFDPGDLLPEVFTRGSVFNGGSFSGLGYAVGVAQRVGDNFEVALSYGNGSNLALREENSVIPDTASDMRDALGKKRHQWGAARVTAEIPRAETRLTATYQTVDHTAVTPGHFYITQRTGQVPGLGFIVRQPIPKIRALPWRLEITADIRNLLAQGYIPVSTLDGRRVYLMQTPKSVRGGLSFIF